MFQSISDVFKQLPEPFNKLAEAYKAYAKFAYITASIIADLIKQLSDLTFAYLTRTKGGPFAEAYAVFHAMKIVKLVGKFGMTLSPHEEPWVSTLEGSPSSALRCLASGPD